MIEKMTQEDKESCEKMIPRPPNIRPIFYIWGLMLLFGICNLFIIGAVVGIILTENL